MPRVSQMGTSRKRSDSLSLPRHVFLQPRRLTQAQIQARLDCQENLGELFSLPQWIAGSTVVDSIFAPARDQLWLSVQEGKVLFNEVRRLWMQTNDPKPLQSTLVHHAHQQKPIQKAVLLALGPVCGKTWDDPAITSHQDAPTWCIWKETVLHRMLQLVVFVCAVETMSDQSGQPIKIFAQDPGFEALDEEFLRSLGIEVVHMPSAESITDHETFVYAPFMIYPHTANSLTRCIKHQPGIYAGHDLDWVINAVMEFPESYSELQEGKQEALERLRAYEKERMFFDVFPHSKYSSTSLEMHGLTQTCVHIRKTVPTADELEQSCTPSCKFVPRASC